MPVLKRSYFHPRRGYVRVKQGFSWPAFLFGSLWAAAKRMWFPTFIAMAFMDCVLWFVTGYAEAQRAQELALLGTALSLVYAYLRGRYGNRFLATSLLSRGYVDRGEVEP